MSKAGAHICGLRRCGLILGLVFHGALLANVNHVRPPECTYSFWPITTCCTVGGRGCNALDVNPAFFSID